MRVHGSSRDVRYHVHYVRTWHNNRFPRRSVTAKILRWPFDLLHATCARYQRRVANFKGCDLQALHLISSYVLTCSKCCKLRLV